ncbi:hypothetical protein EIN_119590 [Entamoeba invadens IP1]|uniref:Uncharacterized protein n=1 Tax=Entamoeba invadens IP1 TaxID=370355 RepID=L7FQ07_ENTIV|nr:hypothetical protein EIN_119590 [Entamoeba invadens IP1]ELP92285.1 hypothetical protein EIN_119590 [Entamoeba invadens IP1]|eukprot:XP_004259056.1 hypothetical protein EIN_119590 [Entamoeba invadens IP1]
MGHMWGLLNRNVIPLVLFYKQSNNELEIWINFLLYRDWKNIIKPDYSIWEGNIDAWTSLSVPLQYYGFTQIQGHHGLLAAAMMEEKYYKYTKRVELLRRRALTYQLHLRDCSGMKRKDTSSKPFGQQKAESDHRHSDCNYGVQ